MQRYQPELDPERCGAVAVGIDTIEIARIKRTLADFGAGFCSVFTRSGSANATVRGFPSWRLDLPPKRQPPRLLEPAFGASAGERWKFSQTGAESQC